MSEKVKTMAEEAAESFAQDTDLDIPLEHSQKDAIRWLLKVAFEEGATWQQKHLQDNVAVVPTI